MRKRVRSIGEYVTRVQIEAVEREVAGRDVPVTLVTGSIDERLDENGYIIPGLGDAGDRLYGVV